MSSLTDRVETAGTPWLPEGTFDLYEEGALVAGFVKNAGFCRFLGIWRPPRSQVDASSGNRKVGFGEASG